MELSIDRFRGVTRSFRRAVGTGRRSGTAGSPDRGRCAGKRFRGRLRPFPAVAVLLLLGLVAATAPAAAATIRLPLAAAAALEPAAERAASGALRPVPTAVLTERGGLFLEAAPVPGEGVIAFAERLSGRPGSAEAIRDANGGARHLQAGVRYRVPWELLRPEPRLAVLEALFPDDRPAPEGWWHRVRGVGPLARESLWRVALWFTGRGESFTELRRVNRLEELELPAGTEVLVPRELLIPELRGLLPDPPPASPRGEGDDRRAVRVAGAGGPGDGLTLEPVAPPPPPSRPSAGAGPDASPVAGVPHGAVRTRRSRRPAAADYRLDYGRDARGDFAVYRLRPGEALYSSVVVRFTGRIHASDVNELAGEIAERSGIADVTDIPVGYAVKIPFEVLSPEYLPPGDPRRIAYEESVEASAAYSNRVAARDLEGITVILDAGHGGADSGTTMGGVWESLYVYDVALRVKRLLESETGARVVMTTRDGDDWRIEERDVLPYSRGHAVLTDPPYRIEDSRVGVNLRWFLANSVYQRHLASGASSEEVVFLSIHGDSLHPSLRGLMAYIPAASLTVGPSRRSGAVYAVRREVREAPAPARLPWKERVRSEGLSRQLAEQLVEAFDDAGLAIHDFKPVREKVIRQRKEWVPAVLRHNMVPAKVMVEIANLANAEDRRLLTTRAWRERAARAVLDGLRSYYDRRGPGDPRVAETAR